MPAKLIDTDIPDAIVLYGRQNIDYIDAYNAVFMRYHRMGGIYSYDEDFDKIERGGP